MLRRARGNTTKPTLDTEHPYGQRGGSLIRFFFFFSARATRLHYSFQKKYHATRRNANSDDGEIYRAIQQELDGPGRMRGYRAMWYTPLYWITEYRHQEERWKEFKKIIAYDNLLFVYGCSTSRAVLASIGEFPRALLNRNTIIFLPHAGITKEMAGVCNQRHYMSAVES